MAANGLEDLLEASNGIGIVDELDTIGPMAVITNACEDNNLRIQLLEYYKWQAAITLLIAITYFRIVKASIRKGSHFSGSIEF